MKKNHFSTVAMHAASKVCQAKNEEAHQNLQEQFQRRVDSLLSQFQEVVLSPTSTSVSSTMERDSPSLQVSPTTTPLSSSTRGTPSMTPMSPQEAINRTSMTSSSRQRRAPRVSTRSILSEHQRLSSNSQSPPTTQSLLYIWLLPVNSNNGSLPVAPDLDEYPRNQRIMLSTAAGGASTKL